MQGRKADQPQLPTVTDVTAPTVDKVNAFCMALVTWCLVATGHLTVYVPGTAVFPTLPGTIPAAIGTPACQTALTCLVLQAALHGPIYLNAHAGYVTGLTTTMGQHLQTAIAAFRQQITVNPNLTINVPVADGATHQLVHGLLSLVGITPASLKVGLEGVPYGEVSWDQGNMHGGELGFAPGCNETEATRSLADTHKGPKVQGD